VSVEQWIGVAMILGGFGWGFYLVLHPELSLIDEKVAEFSAEIDVYEESNR
jgi:hypothetical protein